METRNYKWQLRKGSKKDICPRCGQRRFVPYVLASDNTTKAGEQYGRCDRETSCGYFCYPDGEATVADTAINRVEEEPLRWSPLAFMVVGDSYFDCNFTNWMFETIGTKTTHGFNFVRETMFNYKVRSVYGCPLFWQVTPINEWRAAKMIPYKEDGHRDHSAKFPALFLHKEEKFRHHIRGTKLEQVFFGSHLLGDPLRKKIVIVESEKTALALDILTHGKNCILATGGSQMIKDEARCAMVNEYRDGRPVLVYPDNGQYYMWRKVCIKYGWECSDMMEKLADNPGDDCLDYILNHYEEILDLELL